jgi:hypothetical protein
MTSILDTFGVTFKTKKTSLDFARYSWKLNEKSKHGRKKNYSLHREGVSIRIFFEGIYEGQNKGKKISP